MNFRIPTIITWFLICTLTVCTLTGCSGCTQNTQTKNSQKNKQNKKKDEKEKKKPAYELTQISSLPFSINHNTEPKQINSFFKKGQFATVGGKYTSNKADFNGELRIKNVSIGESDNYVMSFSQPIILPKETPKMGENLTFVKESTGDLFNTRLELTPSGSGIPIISANITSRRVLEPGENLFVLLADIPSKYSHLSRDDDLEKYWAKSEGEMITEESYVILPVEGNKSFDLPTNPLAWSHIAHVLWDNIDPNKVSIEHQMALLDWVHMGGQLVISGPVSLDKLRNSVLWDYLPAEPEGTINISRDQWTQLDEQWNASGQHVLNSEKSRDWTCVKFLVRENTNVTVDVEKDGETVPLFVEKTLGQGRISISAFDLSAINFKQWVEFDNFFNAVVLRRWPREFLKPDKNDLDNFGYSNTEISYKWRGSEGTDVQNTPYLSNSFSLFSRGVRNQLHPYDQFSETQQATRITEQATWDDASPASTKAREILARTSTINIPTRSDIITLMSIYLVIIVPLNWAIFKLIGRLEWAWFAVPVITIAVSVVYVVFTQTEIGFVRKRQEVAYLEVYNDYPRAHLTRYIGLYNSLATNYNLIFESANNSAVLFPFISPKERKSIGSTSLQYHRGADVRISNYGISSNSIGELHSEEITDMQGSIKVTINDDDTFTIDNQSAKLPLQNAVLIDLQKDEVIPIGTVTPLEKVDRSRNPTTLKAAIEKFNIIEDEDKRENIFSLYDLGKMNQIGVERYRLLAWNEVVIPGLRIESEPGKTTALNLVIVHVAPRERSTPKSDTIPRSSFRKSN